MKLLKIIANKWCGFWAALVDRFWLPLWSNVRWRNAVRANIGIQEEDRVKSLKDIVALCNRLFQRFTWTEDGVDQLMDSMTPPPQNYQNYLDGMLQDDCDGFHALLYHCLYNSDIRCYLLTVIAIGGSHCILLFQLNGLWFIADYTCVQLQGSATAREAIEAYNAQYPAIYGTKEVCYNGLQKYDYNKGKYRHVSRREITEDGQQC